VELSVPRGVSVIEIFADHAECLKLASRVQSRPEPCRTASLVHGTREKSIVTTYTTETSELHSSEFFLAGA
jgi:hypothetical protein